jgi:(E)-2-((N-methylformamido)methylene)succinate hydrolase
LSFASELRDSSGTAFFEAGSGSPIVLLHGVGLNAAMWSPIVELMEQRHRVIVPDMLGHGGSPVPPASASLSDYARQVTALMRDLDVERAGVVGFSMGAMVAQRIALDYPSSVSRLALVCAVHDRSLEAKLAVRTRALGTAIHGIAPSVPAALERWFTPSFAAQRPDVIEAMRTTMLGNDPVGYLRSYAIFAQADEELAQEVGRIRAPTLIVAAQDDPGSTPQMAEALHANIRDSQIAVVPGARHMLPLEDPNRLAQLLERFFEE